MKLIREIVRLWIKHSICNGNKTFVRHDNWHPEGALLIRFGHWIVLEAASNVNAKVSSVLKLGMKLGSQPEIGRLNGLHLMFSIKINRGFLFIYYYYYYYFTYK